MAHSGLAGKECPLSELAAAEVDWVEERNQCQPAQVFAAICAQIERDVAQRNEQLGLDDAVFSVRPIPIPDPVWSGFAVYCLGSETTAPVVCFRLKKTEAEIVVTTENGTLLYTVRGHLSQRGDRFVEVVNSKAPTAAGEKMRLWQFSRLALEEYFFGYFD